MPADEDQIDSRLARALLYDRRLMDHLEFSEIGWNGPVRPSDQFRIVCASFGHPVALPPNGYQ